MVPDGLEPMQRGGKRGGTYGVAVHSGRLVRDKTITGYGGRRRCRRQRRRAPDLPAADIVTRDPPPIRRRWWTGDRRRLAMEAEEGVWCAQTTKGRWADSSVNVPPSVKRTKRPKKIIFPYQNVQIWVSYSHYGYRTRRTRYLLPPCVTNRAMPVSRLSRKLTAHRKASKEAQK